MQRFILKNLNDISMKTPVILLIILWSIGLLISAKKHGQPRGEFNLYTTIYAVGIEFLLLYWAGLFNL